MPATYFLPCTSYNRDMNGYFDFLWLISIHCLTIPDISDLNVKLVWISLDSDNNWNIHSQSIPRSTIHWHVCKKGWGNFVVINRWGCGFTAITKIKYLMFLSITTGTYKIIKFSSPPPNFGEAGFRLEICSRGES